MGITMQAKSAEQSTLDREALQELWGAAPHRRTLRRRMLIKQRLWVFTMSMARKAKRWSDILGASVALMALAPVFALAAIAIRLEDGGPVFFAQNRVGLRGDSFRMYKFRSMSVDAEARKAQLAAANESGAGVLFKMKRDPRITRVGHVIRRLSIDEFPQFYNVLKGDMSLVGPRPALPAEVAQYTQAQRARLEVVPGLTCFWQIGGRSDIDFHGQVRLDVRYIQSRSLALDAVILLKTVPAVLLGKGAY
jgi:lipopolysaccharide/colanic/teichoic acid biosynthesis glycosyltransferase